MPRRRVEIEQIDETVGQAFGVAPEDLRRHGRAAGRARAVAVELALRLTGWTQRVTGERYGGITLQAVSMIARKVWAEAEVSTNAGATLRREVEGLAEFLGRL